jgi:hypothetical protein
LSTFWNIVLIATVSLIAISGTLRILDVVTDRDDKERFKARIEKFWLDTADINVKDQLNRALASRYRRSRALRVRFLQLFWIICAIVAFIAGLENASQNPGNFLGILQLDFGTRYAIQCGYILIRDNRTEAADYCDSTKNPTGPPELEHLREEKQNYENFVTKLSDYPGALFAAGFFLKCSSFYSSQYHCRSRFGFHSMSPCGCYRR